MNKHRRAALAPVFQMINYAVLICAVLFLVFLGGKIYQNVNASKSQNEALRSSLAYLHSQIAADDADGAVLVADGPEGDMLVLLTREQDYQTMIYLSNGTLVEELAAVGARPDPARSETICPLSSFSAQFETENTLLVTADGVSTWVTLRSGEVG